jgi:diguanylate cyclase (GGDEF)-like protein
MFARPVKGSHSRADNEGMRRLVDHWWLAGLALVLAVIGLTCALYVRESDLHHQQQRAAQRQAVTVLSESVDDVLARETALARVVGTIPGSVAARWPVLSNIVMSQPLANSAGFIEPVRERDRAAFRRRTGIQLVESRKPGVVRPAARRPLHLVLTADQQAGPGPPPLGLDIAANPLRLTLLSHAARTGLQVATPPIKFLARKRPARGVLVYDAVRDRRGRLKGWVSAAYETQQLESMVTTHMPGVHLIIRDGASTLISDPRAMTGHPAVIAVAGRRWSVWASVPLEGISAVPWLVLSLGLTLAAAVALILRQAASGARRSTRELEQRDAEEAALGRIATLVAQGESPGVVFTSVAEQVATLLNSCTAAVSRFDAASNRGIVLGGWSDEGQDLTGVAYPLDGVTASAEVFRTGRPARTTAGYGSSADPTGALMSTLGGKDGVAAPVTVAGELWGAVGAVYGEDLVPANVEVRLERFASLVGLAISNADAWDRLARQASSDPLTGIANRRTFRERLGAEVARAQRYGRYLSLVLMDLDHFKAVNDLYGHQGGDRVLVLFAQLLSAHSREGELVARIGGEEFAWLMPETDQRGAHTAAERVRRAFEGSPCEDIGRVTVSAGVCSTETAGDADTLVRDADRAMYWAKESGRNMTFLCPAEARSPLGDETTAAPSAAAGAAD